MTNLTVTGLATLPKVNLLPPEIAQARRFRRLQVGLGAGVLAAVGAVGAMTLVAGNAVSSAQEDLDVAKARGAQLQAQQAEYAEVPQVYSQLEAAQAQLSQAMGQEVRWSYFLNDLSLKIPSKVWLTSMTATQNVDPTTPATAVAPGYGPVGIGTITFEGKAVAHNDVAAWLDAMAKQKGLAMVYFTNAKREAIGDRDAITFSSQATLTEDALSGRYTQKAGN